MITPPECEPANVLTSIRQSDRAVRFLLLGVFVNQLGAFVQFFLVLFLLDQGATATHASLALGAYGLGSVLGALLGGRLADWLGRRLTMTLSMLCASVLTIAISLLGAPHLYMLLLLVVAAAGAMTQAYRPAASAMLADLVPAERLVMTFSMFRVALNSGVVIGPLVAVWLISVSWDLLFWIDGLTAIACALVALRWLPADHGARAAASGTAAAQARALPGYGRLLRDGRFLLYLWAMFAGAVIYMQFFTVLPLKIRGDGYSELVYSAMLALSAGVVITCELLVSKHVQTWRATSAAAVGISLLALGLGTYGLGGGLVVLLAGTLIGVLGQMISGPTMFAHPARIAPDGARGSYAGAAQALFGAGTAAGPVLGVLVWSAIGNAVWPVCAAAGMLAAAAAGMGMRATPTAPLALAHPRCDQHSPASPTASTSVTA